MSSFGLGQSLYQSLVTSLSLELMLPDSVVPHPTAVTTELNLGEAVGRQMELIWVSNLGRGQLRRSQAMSLPYLKIVGETFTTHLFHLEFKFLILEV